MARRRSMHFQCGHPGCTEASFFEYESRDEAVRLQKTYFPDKWRCSRHQRPDEVLGVDNRCLVREMRIFEEDHGRFWGTDRAWNGVVFGPGFKAFAADFPPGTKIRVTAEIIEPDPATPEGKE